MISNLLSELSKNFLTLTNPLIKLPISFKETANNPIIEDLSKVLQLVLEILLNINISRLPFQQKESLFKKCFDFLVVLENYFNIDQPFYKISLEFETYCNTLVHFKRYVISSLRESPCSYSIIIHNHFLCKSDLCKFKEHLTWNDYFMGVAMIAAKRSLYHEGACLVDKDRCIIGIGFTGPQMYPAEVEKPKGKLICNFSIRDENSSLFLPQLNYS